MPIILLLSLYFFVKTSDDSFFDWIAEDQIIIELFGQCELYNETVNQISLGILVSCIFYILVVAIPESLKKSIQKRHLLNCYFGFKSYMTEIFVEAADIDWMEYQDNQDQLLNINEFKKFFQLRGKKSSERWYDMLNGLNSDYYRRIVDCCDLFAREIEFSLLVSGGCSNKTYHHLKTKQLFLQSISSYVGEDGLIPYDYKKYVFRELWDYFTGWDFYKGQKDKPSIERLIRNF
jgi:hypothetical protein